MGFPNLGRKQEISSKIGSLAQNEEPNGRLSSGNSPHFQHPLPGGVASFASPERQKQRQRPKVVFCREENQRLAYPWPHNATMEVDPSIPPALPIYLQEGKPNQRTFMGELALYVSSLSNCHDSVPQPQRRAANWKEKCRIRPGRQQTGSARRSQVDHASAIC